MGFRSGHWVWALSLGWSLAMSCSSDEKQEAPSGGGRGGADGESAAAGDAEAGSTPRAGAPTSGGTNAAAGETGAAGSGGSGTSDAGAATGGVRADAGAGGAGEAGALAGAPAGGVGGEGGLACCDASAFHSSTRVLPHLACPAWVLNDTAEPEQPGFVLAGLRLSTSTDAENLYYAVASENLRVPSTLVIEARMKLISGTTSTPSRAPASFGFSYGNGHQKNLLQIANGSIFLLSSENVAGASASVATTDDFHVYRIEVDTANGDVEVFYDGASKLTGSTFVDPNGSPPYILFGEASLFATGISDWDYVTHNAFVCAD